MKRSLGLFLMIVVFSVLFAGCATGDRKLEVSNKIGQGVKFDDGSEKGGFAFCEYDDDIKPGQFSMDLTCSFTITHENVVYSCDHIKLSKFGPNFKLENECTVIWDARSEDKEVTPGEETVLRDFKDSKSSDALNPADATTAMINQPGNYFIVATALNLRFC